MGFIQPGLFSRSESHRWVRQVSPACPRSSTTWSTPRATSAALAANPAGPAPTTTQSVDRVMARRYGATGPQSGTYVPLSVGLCKQAFRVGDHDAAPACLHQAFLS